MAILREISIKCYIFAEKMRMGKIIIQLVFDLVPELAQYRDTTLGDHKWYNGKGGYPDGFDNTKSPIRFMIDIVTLSDCLQASTEKIARNYRYDKKFDVVG